MKFVFIENRYRTYFWDALAREFLAAGHRIAWIVQNPVFMPTTGQVHVIAFPRRSDLRRADDGHDFDVIRCGDRNLNYFGGADWHYPYYWERIEAILQREQPDVVIGEPTLFHELMAALWCRRNAARFLHPSMAVGYPSGRFAIYDGISNTRLGGSEKAPPDGDCLAMAESIRKRELLPEYMRPPPGHELERSHAPPRSFADRRIVLKGYLRGERYNTPAPWRKLRLERARDRLLPEWDRLAAQWVPTHAAERIVLYPLQMQPEANLDVWGQQFRDQVSLVWNLARALPAGWRLQLKLNPKAKYELSPALLAAVRGCPQIQPLRSAMPMNEVLPHAELVVTVTGTIALECVMSGIALAQLGPGPAQGVPGVWRLLWPEQIGQAIRWMDAGGHRQADDASRITFVRSLFTTTFPGKIADPSSMPASMEPNNIRQVADCLLEQFPRWL